MPLGEIDGDTEKTGDLDGIGDLDGEQDGEDAAEHPQSSSDEFPSAEIEEENKENDTNDTNDTNDQHLHPIETSSTIFGIILFIPNLIFVKPMILIWNILVIVPLSYLVKSLEFNYNYQLNSKENIAFLKHDNMMTNNMKSPTLSSKYIIPPPQRLFPLTRNPQAKKRKILVLDLDETLIHSLSQGSPRISNGHDSSIIEIKLNDIATLYYVYKRPYCNFFLQEISKWFDLYIFTASVQEYADPIIDWLESEIIPYDDTKIFKKRFYRNDCTYRNGVGYIKDLSKFFADDLKNVVILDNSPISYVLNETNAVMIEGWINDQNDKDLLNLLPVFYSLSLSIDVRFILGLRLGEKIFEN